MLVAFLKPSIRGPAKARALSAHSAAPPRSARVPPHASLPVQALQFLHTPMVSNMLKVFLCSAKEDGRHAMDAVLHLDCYTPEW